MCVFMCVQMNVLVCACVCNCAISHSALWCGRALRDNKKLFKWFIYPSFGASYILMKNCEVLSLEFHFDLIVSLKVSCVTGLCVKYSHTETISAECA